MLKHAQVLQRYSVGAGIIKYRSWRRLQVCTISIARSVHNATKSNGLTIHAALKQPWCIIEILQCSLLSKICISNCNYSWVLGWHTGVLLQMVTHNCQVWRLVFTFVGNCCTSFLDLCNILINLTNTLQVKVMKLCEQFLCLTNLLRSINWSRIPFYLLLALLNPFGALLDLLDWFLRYLWSLRDRWRRPLWRLLLFGFRPLLFFGLAAQSVLL